MARRGWTRWQILQGQVEVLSKGSGKLVRDFNQESKVMKSTFKTASSATIGKGMGGRPCVEGPIRGLVILRARRHGGLGQGRGSGKETV